MFKLKQAPKKYLWLSACALALLLTACGPSAEPLPTRTPMPTFTPTVATQPTPDLNAAATAQAVAAAATTQAQQAPPPVAPAPSLPVTTTGVTTTNAPAATTPAASTAEVVVNDIINVRGGPGTNYNIVGAADPNERFTVVGKSPDGAWWQINYNGQTGWVFGQLVTPQNTGAVAVAQNIPQPPPPTNTPIPQPTQPPAAPTQAPAATSAPQPTQPPKSTYKFNVAIVGKCERQPAGNWFEGKTYVNGVPQSGYLVAFSYAPDGPIVATMQSGPHPGYPGWDAGYYSHIISSSGPRAGSWSVWIVDEAGQRISEIATWQSTGPGEDCNQAVVDFDSRP